MAVLKVLESPWLTQGPEVERFEKALTRVVGTKYAVAVSSGTTALHLAYLVAGLKKGDEVITSPNTFVATTNMLVAVGAKPVFCDIRLDNYNFDESKIEKLITFRTKAIVPVHFAGESCDMDKIKKLAKKRKLLVIEDACHALGAVYRGQKVGGLSDMSVFSFHPVKSITTGEGGAVLTNSEEYYKKLYSLSRHGIRKDENGFNVMSELGYNYRLTDIGAALGRSQISKLGHFLSKRREVVRFYKKHLSREKEIILPTNSRDSANHLFVIRVKKPIDRLPLMNFLRHRGVGVNFHYPAVYSHPFYQSFGLEADCPNADLYAKTAITLPLFVGLKEGEVRKISLIIKDYFDGKKK